MLKTITVKEVNLSNSDIDVANIKDYGFKQQTGPVTQCHEMFQTCNHFGCYGQGLASEIIKHRYVT